MHGGIRSLLVGVAATTLAGAAFANSDLAKLQADSNNWAAQNGDFALTRHSKLNQINKANAHKLQVAWTFSTGVLRGHEGGPLVIGDTLYVHSAFPNKVWAINLVWPMRKARSSCSRPTPRWSRSTPRPARRSGRSRTATRRSAPPTPAPRS
jgi:glucose dehydrogenase